MTARTGTTYGTADEIAAAIDDMYAAFLAGDRGRFDAHLDPDVTTWESHLPGPLRTRAELDEYRDRRDAAGRRPLLAELVARAKRIDVWGDVGVARYELHSRAEDQRPEQVSVTRVTDVLRRTGDGWRIVHHHAELVRP
ncbi:nuclear transport factor 2 family protein [Dactylosporangium sp. NPDC005572]|uniref:nuclear transport factor 2 family protein n=1 Tax=Dactylosporangium sp. NPDC005572 TaxID=3156889 RepID=UPI0033A5A529